MEESTRKIKTILGFNSLQDFYEMVSEVDISTPEGQKSFKDWINNDGTKEGLTKLKKL